MGGSPCQGFSTIGKGLNFEDPRSRLFFKFVEILELVNPDYFLLENVPMKKAWSEVITGRLGVVPMEINSSLVSAQNRKRLYWTNIPVSEEPKDRRIFLDQIIQTPSTYKIPKNWEKRVPSTYPLYVDPYNKKEIEGKSTALRTNVNNGNMWVKVCGGYRNLTVAECEKLQTVPLGYTSCVGESCAKKMLGNGWTVDVIAHIFKGVRE